MLKKWLNNSEVDFVAEPKIDGLGVSLIYKNGILERALTRGDGFKGEDITHNVKTINAIPLQLRKSVKTPTFMEVRGEIFMNISDFNKLDNLQNKRSSLVYFRLMQYVRGCIFLSIW